MSTVLDQLQRGLRDVRISVMDRCNYRCPYCMPADDPDLKFLPRAQLLGTKQLSTLLKALLTLGTQKLRFTGGEPLLRKDLPEAIAQARALAHAQGQKLEIALTTNGSLLAAQASALRTAGLDRLTISLDSLNAARFAELSGGRGQLQSVLDGIDAAEVAGFAPIKLNCVVQRHRNDLDVLAICERFRATQHVPRFIEFMDVGTRNQWQADLVVPSAELIARIHAVFPLEKMEQPLMGEVAQRYRYLDGAGEIGFISSVSQPFCRGCTRARIAANGMLYTCLFNARGHDLSALLASADVQACAQAIAEIWRQRSDRYSELRAASQPLTQAIPRSKPEMYHLGG
jgi:GTP 3',8-cyclase